MKDPGPPAFAPRVDLLLVGVLSAVNFPHSTDKP